MPAVALVGDGVTVALKWDFGAACRWPREWTVSVRRRSPYLGPTFGLFDPGLDLRGAEAQEERDARNAHRVQEAAEGS